MSRLVRAALSISLIVTATPAAALPLQQIIETAKPAVAHLSIVDTDGEELASGTGFVISNDGKLATNFHVVDRAQRIVAIFGNGRKIDVVGAWTFDADADLAILQLDKGQYSSLRLADKPAVQGEDIVVFGSPRGFAGSASTGIVSAVRKEGASVSGDPEVNKSWTLQISAAISPGSSGSPILNTDAMVVGVAVGSYTGQALNFAIPAQFVKRLNEEAANDASNLKPLTALRSGRTVTQNLMISGAAVAGVLLLGWLLTLSGRRRRRHQERGRDVLRRMLPK